MKRFNGNNTKRKEQIKAAQQHRGWEYKTPERNSARQATNPRSKDQKRKHEGEAGKNSTNSKNERKVMKTG